MDEVEFDLRSRSADRFAAAMCVLALVAAIGCGGFALLIFGFGDSPKDREPNAPGVAHPTSPNS